MKIIADELIPYVKDYFANAGDLILKPGRAITASDVKEADVLLVRSITPVNEALLKNSRVKFVGSVTAGFDHIDTVWLDKAGIQWANASGFNAPPVADYVVSVIAALERRQLFPAHHAKAAVIGVGNTGMLAAERLSMLGIETILCDPLRAKNEKNFLHYSLSDIADVDLVSLHVPLTKIGEHATYHFIDEHFLKRQKPDCVLLNASRGAVIDSAALKKYGNHLQWCFDVWENEPNIDKTILEKSVIATPHIAGYSVQAKMRGVAMIYQAAGEKNILSLKTRPSMEMPKQELVFAGKEHHWQDIVLGVFNPLVMTMMMRTILSASQKAQSFDEMRNQFSYRHEFAYTKVINENWLPFDKKILMKLGMVANQPR